MQLTDGELHLGLFADAREETEKNGSAPETIHGVVVPWDGGVRLLWETGHSVQT